MNIVTTTQYKGFTIQITEEISGYGFLASDDDGSLFGTPVQAGSTRFIYNTPEKAIAQAKNTITRTLNALAYDDDE